MAYFEAKNDGQTYQVEEQSITFALAQLTTPSFGAGNYLREATVTYNGTADSRPVLAFHNPTNTNGVMAVRSESKSGNTWTYKLWLARDQAGIAFANLSSIRAAVFDRPVVGGSGVGVEFYDASAKPLFVANNRQMKVKDVGTGTYPTLATGSYFAVGGGCSVEVDVDFEQLTTMDWEETRIYGLNGYKTSNNSIVEDFVRYDVTSNVGAAGGSSYTEYYGVQQPVYAVEGNLLL